VLVSEKKSSSSLRRSTKSRAERFDGLQILRERDMLSLFAIGGGGEKDAGKELSPTMGDESSLGDELPHDDILEREQSERVQWIMKEASDSCVRQLLCVREVACT